MGFDDMKACIRQLIATVDFLHSEARIIHTDLQLRNLLLNVEESYLPKTEQGQMDDPPARKILSDGRTIYQSQLLIPGDGLPLLGDLREC
ncbi:CMGC protein kinase [Penicillium alfredii]|uniref:CMGC protein kinase n=1 Tax=Penicillium alfredii TaxID=1506179 RepID=A0A9W9FR49_9EURO|nr:CMGC protein kinase [Penicillium alfredii]KAJ5104859.1 CMGC protein kinase [Penicillium alfredii]